MAQYPGAFISTLTFDTFELKDFVHNSDTFHIHCSVDHCADRKGGQVARPETYVRLDIGKNG
jgi:hypothetical protein